MKFELSNHIAHQNPDWEKSESFYKNIMGLETNMEKNHLHVRSGNLNLYIMGNGDLKGTVLEFNVDNIEEVREYLENHGCTVVKWEGKGKDCYMRDPYSLVFNLWETDKN